MLYEFKSRATGSVVMTQPVAERVLQIIGKDPGPQGIVTVDQMPAALQALQAAVEEEKRLHAQHTDDPAAGAPYGGAFGAPGEDARGAPRPAPASDAAHDDDDDTREAERFAVGLAQRVWPFMEMLKASHAAGKDVVWGV